MRAIYAVSFELPAGVAAHAVLETAAGWFCRGRAPNEFRTSWQPGRRSYEVPQRDHTLEVEVFDSAEGRLWQGTWRHPHASDTDLHLISDVEVGVISDAVTLSLVIRAVWAKAKVAPPRFDMRAPRLASAVVERFDVRDAGHPLTGRAQILDASTVRSFVDDLLLDPARTRPVVFVSDDPRGMAPNLEPDDLARELAGLAHVYTSLHGLPGWELEKRLGRLGCADGGVRIWWPGLRLDDNPFRHPLYAGHALRNWQGANAAGHVFRRVSTAAAMNAAPQAHTRLRRSGRLAQIAAATDAEARDLVAYALDDNERLTQELNSLSEAHDELELERDEYAEKLRSAEEEKDAMQRNFAEALAAVGVETPLSSIDGAASDEELEVKSVRSAVDAAVTRCPHLAFAERSFESADDSPFESPASVLDALMKLEHVASRWARVGGIGGMDVGQAAIELGLDWKADVGDVAKRERHYAFVWNGEKRTMGPHVRLGGGSGAARVARIYLDRYEPRDPTDRKLIVAHVGRKLPDTTTG